MLSLVLLLLFVAPAPDTSAQKISVNAPLPDVRQYRKRPLFVDPFSKIEEKAAPKPESGGGRLPEKKLDVKLDIPEAVIRQMEVYLNREEIRRTQGYRVQIYSGVSSLASDARFNFLEMFPDYNVYTFYDKPFFKVRVGNFISKKEAETFCSEIKNYFPPAFVVPAQVEIKQK